MKHERSTCYFFHFQDLPRPNGSYFLCNQQRFLTGYLDESAPMFFSTPFCPLSDALRCRGLDPSRRSSGLHSHCRVQGSRILLAKKNAEGLKWSQQILTFFFLEKNQGPLQDGWKWYVSSLRDGGTSRCS